MPTVAYAEHHQGGRKDQDPLTKNGGRVLVPFFVPDSDSKSDSDSAGDYDLRVNEGLQVFNEDFKTIEKSYESVRTWNKDEGYFVQETTTKVVERRPKTGKKERQAHSRRSQGNRSSSERRRLHVDIDGSRGNGRSKGRGGGRKNRGMGKRSVSLSPVGVMAVPTTREVPSPPKDKFHTPRPTQSCRFAGSSFESASPSPLALPLPNFTKKMTDAIDEGNVQDELRSMSLDLRRLLKI